MDDSSIPDLPRGTSIDQTASHLEIRWPWRSRTTFWVVILAAFLMIMPICVILIALGTPEDPIPLWIIAIFVLLGLGGLYAGLQQLLNQVILTVDRAELTITHKPIPWRDKRMAAQDIQQLYVKRIVATDTTQYGRYRSVAYHLFAQTADGKQRLLLSNLHHAGQAKLIETHIEDYLGIEDTPVEGEYRPADQP